MNLEQLNYLTCSESLTPVLAMLEYFCANVFMRDVSPLLQQPKKIFSALGAQRIESFVS